MSEADELNRRTHLRMATKLAARHRRVSPEELAALRSHLCMRDPMTGSKVEPELIDHIARLERKLDQVLSLIVPDIEAPLLTTEICEVELSGSGIGYVWPESLECDEEVICELILPGVPPHPIRMVAKVVRCTPAEGGFKIGLAFSAVDERDRDAIVRHVNRVQLVARNSEDP